jgi:uncharacterized membrane protein YhaH (DUF805 family)
MKKYAAFQGRARRREFWFFNLFYFLIMSVLNILLQFLGANAGTVNMMASIFALAFILPILALFVRRLHDIGKSGWWILLGFIPIVGLIIILVWVCSDSQEGANQYGPTPKEV